MLSMPCGVHTDLAVCFVKQLSSGALPWWVMEGGGRWKPSDCWCLARVWRMKTRKLSARGGRAAPTGGDTPTGTNTTQQHNSNQPNDTHLGADWFVCVGFCFFLCSSHWWPLLCGTSVQWWHHCVWEAAAIFRHRRRVGLPPHQHLDRDGEDRARMTCNFFFNRTNIIWE